MENNIDPNYLLNKLKINFRVDISVDISMRFLRILHELIELKNIPKLVIHKIFKFHYKRV